MRMRNVCRSDCVKEDNMMFASVRGRFFPVTLVVALNSWLVMVSYPLLGFGQTKDATTLHRAMRDGTVVAIFKGTGGSSGDSVEVEVAKTPGARSGRLDLTIPPGSMLHSSNGAEQSMVIMGVEGRSTGGGMFEPTSHITVSTTKPVRYILSAFCAEFEKENPSTTDTFALEEPVPILACLAREGKRLSVAAQQAAVWLYTDRMTYGRMTEKFAVSQEEWASASRVVDYCRSSGIEPNVGTTTRMPDISENGPTSSTFPLGQVSKNKLGNQKQTRALQGRNDQMQTGVLAIMSDEAGTLFIDGVRGAALLPNQIVTLKLVAGQHFAELHDANNQKRWEKVVDVPEGAQVAQKIDLHARTSSGEVSRQTPEAPQQLVPPPLRPVPDQTPGFPKPAADSTPLDATMQFIQTKLNELGNVNFTLYGHDKKKKSDWTFQKLIATTGVVADPSSCVITYHEKASDNDKTVFDRDFAFSLRDAQKSIIVLTFEEGLKEDYPKAKNSFRTAPTAFVFKVFLSGNRRFDFIFTDQETAKRVANAMSYAVKLCGGDKVPF